jgi:hypothetical protein
MQFFNLKTKQMVEIADAEVSKRRSVRVTSGGSKQERYAAVAEVRVDGKPLKLFKFVDRATFDRLPGPEIT